MNGHPASEIKTKVAEASRILKLDEYLKRNPPRSPVASVSGRDAAPLCAARVFSLTSRCPNLDAEAPVEIGRNRALHKRSRHDDLRDTDQVEA
jgi:lactose/L-arabinose transport system ATP-binding protein